MHTDLHKDFTQTAANPSSSSNPSSNSDSNSDSSSNSSSNSSSDRALKLSSLSVFFPCFNEEKNLPQLIKQALNYIPTIAEQYELIIVNDGSQDNTQAVAQELSQRYQPVRVVSHERNLGYGAALQTGFARSRYEWIFFTDADLQFDITELQRFLPYTDQFKAIIGYRRQRAEGGLRAFNARLFKLYIDVLFRLHVRDVDCAFKLLRADHMRSLDLFSQGAFISAEFLYKLKKQGVKFKQLAVNHYPRQHGEPTGANPKVIVQGVWDALKLYLTMKFKRLVG